MSLSLKTALDLVFGVQGRPRPFRFPTPIPRQVRMACPEFDNVLEALSSAADRLLSVLRCCAELPRPLQIESVWEDLLSYVSLWRNLMSDQRGSREAQELLEPVVRAKDVPAPWEYCAVGSAVLSPETAPSPCDLSGGDGTLRRCGRVSFHLDVAPFV